MLAFVCDWCGRPKQPQEAWILGFAAETVGRVVCRREISFAPSWSNEWARHPLAVHFCSRAHKESYVQRFLNSPASPVLRKSVSATVANRTQRAASTKKQALLAHVSSNRKPSGEAARTAVSRPPSKKAIFSKSDRLRAHGLGILLSSSDRYHSCGPR